MEKTMKILCYGDSNTWGHDPKNGSRFDENTRWTRLLQKKLGKEHEIIEEGLCGRTAAFMDDVIPYRHGISMLEATLEINQPIDLVVIMLGTNDLKSAFHPDAYAITNGIKKMIKIIRNPYLYISQKKLPEILIVSPIHIHSDLEQVERYWEGFGKRSLEVSRKLASWYEALTKEMNCHFMDASLYAQASTIDCIHMDEENHKKFAEAIYEKIENIIASN